MTLCVNIVVCPSLPPLANGTISYSDPTLGVGSVATHSCDTGFILNGTSFRTCQSDGTWNGSALLYCIIPDFPYLSLGSTTITTNNTEVLITDIGEDNYYHYYYNEPPPLTCHTDLRTCCRNRDNYYRGSLGRWYYPNGGTINNYYWTDFYTTQSFLSITLNRRDSRNPLSPTGSYCCVIPTTGGEMTLCVNIVVCPSLPPLANGTISYSDPTLGVGSVATYICDTGYGSNNTQICTRSRKWSATSNLTCKAITCPPLPGHPYGSITYSPDNTPPYLFGTQAVYTTVCPEGLERRGGNDVMTCTGDGSSTSGTWNGTAPVCLNQSIFLSFGEDNYFANNTPIIMTSIGSIDDTALNCHTDSTTCCRNRHNLNGFVEWVFPGGTRIPQNSVSGDGFYWIRDYQVIRLYRQGGIQDPLGSFCCRIPDSYGAFRTFCAHLVAIQCSSLENPNRGNVSYSKSLGENESYSYGTIATYFCSPGFGLSSNQSRVCVGDDSSGTVGRFNGSQPTCEAVICPALLATVNGIIVFSGDTTKPYVYGTTATYQCDSGYELMGGDTVRTCTGDGSSPVGQWNGTAPNCSVVSCGSPLSILNGSPGTTTSTTFGGTVTYSCDRGFVLFGNHIVQCLASSHWSSLPFCSGIEISVSQQIQTIGQALTISCTVTNVSADSIQLLRDGQAVSRVRNTNQLSHALTVNDSLHHSQFRCEAQLMGLTAHSNSTQVIVKIPPGAIHTYIYETASRVVGQDYRLVCEVIKTVSGLTNVPRTQWFNNKGLIVHEQPALIFSPLKTSHAGSYRCEGSITSSALTQPLVTSDTWDLTVRIPLPVITVILTNSNESSKLHTGDIAAFTCQVYIDKNMDTGVNVSLTWVQQFHGEQPDNVTTVYALIINSTSPVTITKELIIEDVTSLNQRVVCKGTVYPIKEQYISASDEANQTISFNVTGVFLRVNHHILQNSTSLLVSELQTIQCHSDGGQPQWRLPDGTTVGGSCEIFPKKFENHLTIREDNSTSVPLGQYCCQALDAKGVSHTLCVNIISESLIHARNVSNATEAVLLSLVALLFVIAIISVALNVYYTVKNRKRKSDSSRSPEYDLATQTKAHYEYVSTEAVYEEIDLDRSVKVPEHGFDCTHNDTPYLTAVSSGTSERPQ